MAKLEFVLENPCGDAESVETAAVFTKSRTRSCIAPSSASKSRPAASLKLSAKAIAAEHLFGADGFFGAGFYPCKHAARIAQVNCIFERFTQ